MEARRKALGRGIGALIPGAGRLTNVPDELAGEPISEVPIEAVLPNRYQPRQEFQTGNLDELVRSISQNGVIQPLVVRRNGTGFELIAGERRFRAAQKAGLSKVPVVVREASDREALELALIENLQREDLNPLDEALAYSRLMQEFELTQDAVADRVSKSRPAVANTLRLLYLPDEVKADIRAGRLSGGHARAIAGAADAATRVAVAREVVEKRLSVRDTEKRVREMTARPDPDHTAVEEQLRQSLGTKVRIVPRKNGSGRIEIEYYSLAELGGLVDRLTAP